MTDFLHRYLDPSDTLGELLFGLIMALTLTLGARLLTQASEVHPRELVVALVGCNIAWGVIDSVLYLLGTIFYRNQRRHFVRRLKTAPTDHEALAAIREEYDLDDEPLASDQDRAAFHRTLLEVLKHAKTHRAHLHRQDYLAALLIVVLVSATALPGVVPLLLIEDKAVALRGANLVQVCLLFCIGFVWARHTGANPWRTGLVIVLLGVALVGVAVALGG
jgi:predicted membrane channel-forming protein YqfA (hemolysin III family)